MNHLFAFKDCAMPWINSFFRHAACVLLLALMAPAAHAAFIIVNTLDEYPASMRQLARHEDTPLIDLNAMSKTLFEALGPEDSKKAFVHYPAGAFPGQDEELADDSHFSNYGAYQLARCVVEGIIQADLDLKRYLKSPEPYDPANPDPFDEFVLPHSPSLSPVRPAGN